MDLGREPRWLKLRVARLDGRFVDPFEVESEGVGLVLWRSLGWLSRGGVVGILSRVRCIAGSMGVSAWGGIFRLFYLNSFFRRIAEEDHVLQSTPSILARAW